MKLSSVKGSFGREVLEELNYGTIGESPSSGSLRRMQKTYVVKYYGRALVERWHTPPMLPWIVAEVKRLGTPKAETVFVTVTDSSLVAIGVKYGRQIFDHKLINISKFSQTTADRKCFSYITRDVATDICLCHVFQAADEPSVIELFTTIRENAKEVTSHSGSCPFTDISLTTSQQFEVLYVGRIKVPQKRAIPSFIDDAVEKFKMLEQEKQSVYQRMKWQKQMKGTSQRRDSTGSIGFMPIFIEQQESCPFETINEEKESNSTEYGRPKEKYRRRLSDSVISGVQLSLNKHETNGVEESGEKAKTVDHHLNNGDHKSCETTTSVINNPVQFSDSQLHQSLLSPDAYSLITHTQSLDAPARKSIIQDLQLCSRKTFDNVDEVPLIRQSSLPPHKSAIAQRLLDIPPPRTMASDENSYYQHNRTMLFLIGKKDVCLISTDKKRVLLNKAFIDISHCSQGIKHKDHFSFICRESTLTTVDSYTGYIFRCQSEKLVDELMRTLKQVFCLAHQTYHQKITHNQIAFCDTCPLHWFHKLCVDVEGLNPDKIQMTIIQYIATLTDREQRDIMNKYHESKAVDMLEQNIIFMMFLRALCEQKQMKHTHVRTTVKQDSRQEAEKKPLLSLDSFRLRAKKSFSGPLESLLKHTLPVTEEKTTPDDIAKEKSQPASTSVPPPPPLVVMQPPLQPASQSLESLNQPLPSRPLSKSSQTSVPIISDELFSKRDDMISSRPPNERSLSDTAAILKEIHEQRALANMDVKYPSKVSMSPMRNIFLKVGSQNKLNSEIKYKGSKNQSQKGSWRKSIFRTVQTHLDDSIFNGQSKAKINRDDSSCRRSRADIQGLWKKAIMEQVLLIRMEKERDKKISSNYDGAFKKRLKLDYEDITPCLHEVSKDWDVILNNPEDQKSTMQYKWLEDAVKRGVPRAKRGEIWKLLTGQLCKKCMAENIVLEDDSTSYKEILKQLTPHQHAILIDIGRTFPSHPYYTQPLGPGQLSLFSLLKAYSLYDPDVGYCQGLSFVVGVLLLHLSEEEVFQMLKHIMFHLGFRKQYKPDMAALQIQMYQFSRLVYDSLPAIHEHFEKYEIPPTLYATSWFLTLFSSQFPLGFVSRLLDLIFLQGMQSVFKVALLLLKTHQREILKCSSFESTMEYLKVTIPCSGNIAMERALEQVFTLDIKHQLYIFEVEYHVLHEEVNQAPDKSDPSLLYRLQTENQDLQKENNELNDKLQVSQTNVHTLEASVASYQSTIKHLESRVRSLQDERDALLHSVSILRHRLEQTETSSKAEEEKKSTEKEEVLSTKEKDQDVT